MTHGSFCFLALDYQFISYGRFSDKEQIIVVINNGKEEKEVNIPVWKTGVPQEAVMERMMMTLETGFHLGEKLYEVKKGILYLKAPAVCSMILRKI